MPAHPRLRRLLVAAVALLILIGVGVAILFSRQPGDVSNPGVAFDAHDHAGAPAVTRRATNGVASFSWPTYGYDAGRTRYLPLPRPFRPPFAERWQLGGNVLLEFPPALGGRSLFLLKDDGLMLAIERQTGHVRWRRQLGHLSASSPAYANGVVYATILERGTGVNAGRVVALSAATGRPRWSIRLPSRTESSPLVDRGTVYFGTESGAVYALNAGNGAVRWIHHAPGAVKGGIALDHGRLFLGTYGGTVQALRRASGTLIWSSGTSGGRFGLRSGNFYATPAAAFGRVYIGNTDGFVYSFAQSDGSLAWRKQTGDYVYSSAAVAQVPGTPPTVYVGSYDRNLYALDARSGSVRWQHHTEGRVSGGVVVLGDLVFYSTLARTTTALRAKDGQTIWFTRRGGFNPVVSTGRGIFLVGYTNLYGLDGRPPQNGAQVAAARQRAAAAARRLALYRRVAQREAQVRQRNALIASGAIFCSRQHGRMVCRPPQPLVCARRASDGQTICTVPGRPPPAASRSRG